MKRHIKNDVLAEVMRLCGGKCVHCGATENLQFGHIIPHSRGGSKTVSNLIIECETCNKKKGTKFLPTKFFNLETFSKNKSIFEFFRDHLKNNLGDVFD